MDNAAPWFRTQSYNDQRQQALVQFGVMLRRWRERNGWSQHTGAQWAKAAGFSAPAAGNISNLERGIAGAPSPSTIMMLADLNARIAAREWGPVTGRQLRDRLMQAEPITDDDGTAWGPLEFWGASVGMHPIPEQLQNEVERPMPQVDPKELCHHWRELLAAAVLEHDLDAAEVITAMAKPVPAELRRRLRQVLAISSCHLEREELPELWVNGWLPEQGLRQVVPED
jgi:transcriptional regulator with XRE-family HTH domain